MSGWDFKADDAVIVRYTKALYEVSVEIAKEKEVLEQVKKVREFVGNLKDVKKFLKRCTLMMGDGFKFIDEMSSSLNLLPQIKNFIKLLLMNKRFERILEICDNYATLVDRIHGKKIFLLTFTKSSHRLSSINVMDKLKKAFGSNIDCVVQFDEDLLGGFTIQHKSKILDYSVKSKLVRLNKTMKGEYNEVKTN